MKTFTILFFVLLAFTGLQAQDQSINGNLHLTVANGGTLRFGKIGDAGNLNVPVGSITGQYNIDFSGYRDMTPDQIGARIAAIRYNAFQANLAYVQHTGLAFYTNSSGWLPGIEGVQERLRITPNGNIGIGTSNPQSLLDVAGTIKAQEVKIEDKLNIHTLDCQPSTNLLTSVLARLQEGNTEGEGTYLGVKSYSTQATNGIPLDKVKSFSIEHKFYGRINNSIDFYRGGGMTGGYIGITVNDGSQISRFHSAGMDIAGLIKAREIKVEITSGADHVFNPDYGLKPLSEIEHFIKTNKHLPDVPSEQQMQAEGLNINEFQIKLLQKIEELTLYVIQQEKKNMELEQKLETIQTALSEKQ